MNFSCLRVRMFPSILVDAINTIILEASTPSALERRIILRLFNSTNKILRNLFGSEAYVIGSVYNNILRSSAVTFLTK